MAHRFNVVIHYAISSLETKLKYSIIGMFNFAAIFLFPHKDKYQRSAKKYLFLKVF